MSTELTVQQPKTIQELYLKPETQLQRDELLTFLNQEPPADWVKVHPYIKNHKYLPIQKVEWMLKRFFKKYSIEVKETKQMLNSIMVCVRVGYLDPLTEEMNYHDGVGACELQTGKDTGPLKIDASNINLGAVPMALGIAKSVAVKDACDHIGTIFGSDLNRKDSLPYAPDTGLAGLAKTHEHNRMEQLIAAAKTRVDLDKLRPNLTDALNIIFEEKWSNTPNK